MAFQRKRIRVSNPSIHNTPLKKKQRRGCCSDSKLEALPQEIVIKILCGIDHEDLKQVLHVSRAISEATVIAKEWHFDYSTRRRVRAFRRNDDSDEIEAPRAPRQQRKHMRFFPSSESFDQELSFNLFID